MTMSKANAELKTENMHTLLLGDRIDYDGQVLAFGNTTLTRAGWRDMAEELSSDSELRRSMYATMLKNGENAQEANAEIEKMARVSAILAKGDVNAPVPHVMNAFIANESGSVAYHLEGNLPMSQKSTAVCIRGKFSRSLWSVGRDASKRLSVQLSGIATDVVGGLQSGAIVQVDGDIATGEFKYHATVRGKPVKMFDMTGTQMTPALKAKLGGAGN